MGGLLANIKCKILSERSFCLIFGEEVRGGCLGVAAPSPVTAKILHLRPLFFSGSIHRKMKCPQKWKGVSARRGGRRQQSAPPISMPNSICHISAVSLGENRTPTWAVWGVWWVHVMRQSFFQQEGRTPPRFPQSSPFPGWLSAMQLGLSWTLRFLRNFRFNPHPQIAFWDKPWNRVSAMASEFTDLAQGSLNVFGHFVTDLPGSAPCTVA